MIDLGTTEFRFASPAVSQAELKLHTTQLFDRWESYIHANLSLPDYSLYLQVEEGSIKGGGAVAALLGALYFGIGNYGDFVSGLKTIGEQVASAGEFLSEQAPGVFGCSGAEPQVRRRGGTIAGLQKLFVKVQRGDLSPEEAAKQAERLLGDDSRDSPGFLRDLAKSFRDCPRHHEQIPLPLVDSNDPPSPFGETPTRPRTPSPHIPVLAPPLHLRIEVWRESKKKRKRSRVVQF